MIVSLNAYNKLFCLFRFGFRLVDDNQIVAQIVIQSGVFACDRTVLLLLLALLCVLDQIVLIEDLVEEQNGHVCRVAGEHVPQRVQLAHGLQAGRHYAKHHAPLAACTWRREHPVDPATIGAQVLAALVVHVPEEEADEQVCDNEVVDARRQAIGAHQRHRLRRDRHDHERIGGLVERRTLPHEAVDERHEHTVGEQRGANQPLVAQPVCFSLKALPVFDDERLVGVDGDGRAVDHGQLVEQLHRIEQRHVEHPAAGAHKRQAGVAPVERARYSICRVVFVVVVETMRPVDAVERQHDHDQVGDGVPELGDVVRVLVVVLAPVDGGRALAPQAAVAAAVRRHFLQCYKINLIVCSLHLLLLIIYSN